MADNFDKFLPDWQIGTLTLTANSTAFTATDALLTFGSIQQGDFIISPDGRMLVIENITDDDNGVLSTPCPPEAAGTFQTRIRYQSDNSRYTGQTAALRRLLSGGNLFALSKLAGDPEKIVRFLGNGAFDLVDYLEDPNGILSKLAALTDIGTLGLGLLPLAKGTSAQIIQADSTLIDKIALPVSTATQTALNGKFNTSGGTATGRIVAPGLTSIGSGGASTSIAMHPFGVGDTRRGELYTELSGTVNTVLRVTNPPSSQDVFFVFRSNGSLTVPGALSKGSGTFLIDHPKDPFNKNLRHGFVESTEYVNLYRGMVDLVDGRMTVDIDAAFGMTDGTFEALNADVMVSSMQNQYGPERVWVEAPADSGKFTIICEDAQSTATVAWMVTGRRNDAFVRSDLDPNTDSEGRFIPEFDKEDA